MKTFVTQGVHYVWHMIALPVVLISNDIRRVRESEVVRVTRWMGTVRADVTLLLVGLFLLVTAGTVLAKTFYLDGQLSANCTTGNYSTAARTCTGADGAAYNNLQDAINNLVGGDTLYVRSGTYIRTTNNGSVGSLAINASGTAAQHTVVRGYGSEQQVVCTQSGKCQYNPDPGDTSFANSSLYYPNPAISIGAEYVDVIGFKTFGQVLISASNATIQNSDLGGGGPHIQQGAVVMIRSTIGISNIVVKNNMIHHSAWGESNTNGSSIMGYCFTATIENNEFYDAWGSDIHVKDNCNQSGRDVIIRYNFFRPTTIGGTNVGISGPVQFSQASNTFIHNNIFYKKSVAIGWDIPSTVAKVAYNNTFVDNTRDITHWNDQVVNAQNNLHYHSSSSQWHYDLTSSLGNLTSNHNLYYTVTGTTTWKTTGCNTTSFTTWKTCSGKDAGSITDNPNFVNPTGSRPEDFKRTSYPNEVSGSAYGTVTGAYETGNEVIGVSPSAPSDTTPPTPPTGLRLN